MERYYKILGFRLCQKPTIEEVRAAYKRLALKYHPDRTIGGVDGQERMKEINEAYDEIKQYHAIEGSRHVQPDKVEQKQCTSITIKNNQKITKKTIQILVNGVVVEQHEQVYITTL